MPNALLVYPKVPLSYWGMQYAMEFLGKKSTMPPLGLLTIAGLFPEEYELRLVDMNVRPLTQQDLEWADVVFVSSMAIQQESLRDVIQQCNNMDVPIIAGGPYPTLSYDEIKGVNYFILGECEEIFLNFLEIESKRSFRGNGIYGSVDARPNIDNTPIPRFELINFDDYDVMPLQWCRGCHHNCEFCLIGELNGRKYRTKSIDRMIAEFQYLYDLGWRGPVFIVDDNFIGHKQKVMHFLYTLVYWQNKHKHPFSLYTEASTKLADSNDLMTLMVDAGFYMVFLGIETPNQAALNKIGKYQNLKHEDPDFLLKVVRKIQRKGLEVNAGFILGLDSDTEEIFDLLIDFIQKSGIAVAMVGFLNVPKRTRMYDRMFAEGRILGQSLGDNVSLDLNYIPEMDPKILISGYKRVQAMIYPPNLWNYFRRVLTMFCHVGPNKSSKVHIGKPELRAFRKSIKYQLFNKKQGLAYLLFLLIVLVRFPWRLDQAIRFAIIGYHHEKVTSNLDH
ncbi:B12-binding domain-containing radical SAM protein [Patescibacteria group bacterium]